MMAGGLHIVRFDPDGNALTIVSDPTGRVHIEIENETVAPRRAHQATIESDELVLLAYELLRLARDAEGSDAVDAAIVALAPYSEERDRRAHMADALWAPAGEDA